MKIKKSMRLFLVFIIILGLSGIAFADCGSVPFSPGRGMGSSMSPDKAFPSIGGNASVAPTPTPLYDPMKIGVYEPGQRALICWNGEEEILLLSTDQKATEKSYILEVIPLPAEPKVSLGKFETFEKAKEIIVKKRLWTCAHGGVDAGKVEIPADVIKITFSEKLGAHDITVAQSLNGEKFVEAAQEFLKKRYDTEKAPINPLFTKIIQSYIDEGFQWFCFDVIELGDQVQSKEPIQYRFKSECAFYPLRISSLELGVTKAEVTIISSKGISDFGSMPMENVTVLPKVNLTMQETETINPEWKGFFTNKVNVIADEIVVEDKSANLVIDVRAK